MGFFLHAIMIFRGVLLLSLLVVCSLAADELVSKTTFKPEKCDTMRKTKKGDSLSMHYTGTIDESSKTGEKNKKFDSSLDRGDPFEFVLGTGQVIKGWDQGLMDMCVGEKRTLVIPPVLGYGGRGAGNDIPGGATLRFTVECLGIKDAPPQPNIFKDIDHKHGNKDGKLTKEEIAAWFKKEQGQDELPPDLWKSEDKNGDGVVSWDEFSGPKGDKEEL